MWAQAWRAPGPTTLMSTLSKKAGEGLVRGPAASKRRS